MYIEISDEKKIKSAQMLLEKRLMETLPQRHGSYVIGYQGGNITVDNLLADHRIWFYSQYQYDTKKYWNAFGLADQLNISGSNNIAVEINIPLVSSKRVGGIFAYDSQTKNIVLLHRGNVGGGREGIGKSAFIKWYNQDMVEFDNNGSTDNALFVADLRSPDVAKQISKFVIAVSRFKTKIKEDDIAALDNDTLAEKAKSSKPSPKRTEVKTMVYNRNPYVVVYVKRRAQGKCDLCEKKAPFSDDAGNPYLECHHVEWLSDGGYDAFDNAVALCPNCHRKMHIINNAKDVAILKHKAKRTL